MIYVTQLSSYNGIKFKALVSTRPFDRNAKTRTFSVDAWYAFLRRPDVMHRYGRNGRYTKRCDVVQLPRGTHRLGRWSAPTTGRVPRRWPVEASDVRWPAPQQVLDPTTAEASRRLAAALRNQLGDHDIVVTQQRSNTGDLL